MGFFGVFIFVMTIVNGYHLADWINRWYHFYSGSKSLAILGITASFSGFSCGVFWLIGALEASSGI